MKSSLRWLIVSSTLISSASIFAKDGIFINEKMNVKVVVETNRVFSQECRVPASCFTFPSKLKYSPNQNPLFSLCYQSQGEPLFGKVGKRKVTICKDSKGRVVDLNFLMETFEK